jgi:hypothetical protein
MRGMPCGEAKTTDQNSWRNLLKRNRHHSGAFNRCGAAASGAAPGKIETAAEMRPTEEEKPQFLPAS